MRNRLPPSAASTRRRSPPSCREPKDERPLCLSPRSLTRPRHRPTGTSPTAEEIGRQLLTFGRRMNLAETLARVDDITAADVKRVADKVCWDQEVSFAAIGSNLKYIGDINSLRRGTYWNRV